MNLETAANFALKQVDNLGYYLSRYGVSNKVNRHNLIALAMTEKSHLLGEYSRMELKAKIQRNRLEKQVFKLNQQADEVIAMAPKPIALQLNKAKALII